MMTEQQIKDWFKTRNLKDFQYQIDSLLEIQKQHSKKSVLPTVLAASPSSGKTLMTICYIDFYLTENPKAKVLILAHGTKVLRSQFYEDINKAKVSFTYKAVDDKAKDFDAQVIVTLPQSLKSVKKLSHFDLLVVDEAHHFYFSEDGLVSSVIKKIKPKHYLLLTGTPSKFIRKKYPIIPITITKLLECGVVTDVYVELATSSYKFKESDYQNNEVKEKAIKKKETTDTMDILLGLIIERVQSSYKRSDQFVKNKKSLWGKVVSKIKWLDVLKELKKTMIACKSQDQARYVKNYLVSKGIDVALSISEEDKDSKEIQRFIERVKDKEGNDTKEFLNPDCLVLIVVNRGILGFNLPELENVVDMTLSETPDVIFQLLGRVLRKHPDNREKLFFKIAPSTRAHWVAAVMRVVLALSDEETYLKFNGKNMKEIPMKINHNNCKFAEAKSVKERMKQLVELNKKLKLQLEKDRANGGKLVRTNLANVDFEEFKGVPAIQMFNNIKHDDDALLHVYKWTTLEKVKAAIFEHKNRKLTNEEHIQDFIKIHV